MDDLKNRLNLNPGATGELHHHCLNERPKISKIARLVAKCCKICKKNIRSDYHHYVQKFINVYKYFYLTL